MRPAIQMLIESWKRQNIEVCPTTPGEIEQVEKKNSLFLPDDFREFYSIVNGMSTLYPNNSDEEGFLFYPIEAVISAKGELGDCALGANSGMFVFADYLLKCWYYGVEVKSESEYLIGIIPDKETFTPITDSLWTFLELYLADSPTLYEY